MDVLQTAIRSFFDGDIETFQTLIESELYRRAAEEIDVRRVVVGVDSFYNS